MRGEFIGVWSETWREIWEDVAAHEAAPNDLFCELYRELASALKTPLSIEELADIIDDPVQSKEVLGRWGNGDVEVTLSSLDELPYVMGLVRQSFERQMGIAGDA